MPTSRLFKNIDVIAMGFGITDDDGHSPQHLRYASLKTLPFKVCRATYPDIEYYAVICANNVKEHQSICAGDSGGPLVTSANGILVGITSFGKGKNKRPNRSGF